MIAKLRNKLNFTSVLVASTFFLFSTLSSITKAEDRFFYHIGASYVEGSSNSTFLSNGRNFAGNIEGQKLDFGIGLSSEIKNIKVDYILSYSPDAFGNQVDTTNSCPNHAYECNVNIKNSLDLGVKFYLPSTRKITPTVYLGVSNADIQLKTINRTGADVGKFEHQKNWGGTACMGLNYDLNNYTAISFDYTWTAYERNIEETDTIPNRTTSRVEVNSLSLKLKKYF